MKILNLKKISLVTVIALQTMTPCQFMSSAYSDSVGSSYINSAWNQLPDFGVLSTLESNVKSVTQRYVDDAVTGMADKIAKKAKAVAHAKLYRFNDRHVVDNEGNSVGYVEANDSRFVRTIIEKATGWNPDNLNLGIPGSSAVLGFVFNKLENYIAGLLEGGLEDKVASIVTTMSMKAVGNALDVGNDKLETFLSSVNIENEASDVIASEENAALADYEIEGANRIYNGLRAKVSLYLNDLMKDATKDVTNWAVSDLTDRVDCYAQGGLMAAGGLISYSLGFGSFYSAAIVVYNKIMEPGKGAYLSQFTNWMIGIESNSNKVKTAASFQVDRLIDALYNRVMGDIEADQELVYGTYETHTTTSRGEDTSDDGIDKSWVQL